MTAPDKFVGLTGTTCVGKSAVAVQLAKRLGTYVISADSMQIYKGMDIGTAKISSGEMQGVQHYMLDIVEPNCNFSAGDYIEMTSKLIHNATKPPVVCGGTGFYFDSLLFPSEFDEVSPERRAELQAIAAQPDGLQILTDLLRQLDPDGAKTIDLRNPKRVLRAVEIAESGKSVAKGVGRNRVPMYDAQIFVLHRDRDELYRMTDRRVDEMVGSGLFEEVQRLVDKYGICDTTAFSAIGYKEIVECLQGKCTRQEAIDRIKLNTRHYVKRQITYFKRLPFTIYIDVTDKTVEQVVDEILTQIR